MSFYQIMQLSPANIKSKIKETTEKKEKRRYIAALISRAILCLIFCVGFVMTFSLIFGEENSVVGVVSVILLLTFRASNLDIDVRESTLAILGVYIIYAIGPYLASISNSYLAAIINFVSILLLVVITCHNMILSNQIVVILSYLLLFGYEVSSKAIYTKRIFALIFGGIIVATIFYIKQRNNKFEHNFIDILKHFNFKDSRTRWQIKISILIATSIFIGELLNFERTMWIGFACMSIIQPEEEKLKGRLIDRPKYAILGCIIFTVVYCIIPKAPTIIFGMIGGLMVGFSGTYRWQTVFNSFGALSVAIPILGFGEAIFFRVICNVFGALYIWICLKGYDMFKNRFQKIEVLDGNEIF